MFLKKLDANYNAKFWPRELDALINIRHEHVVNIFGWFLLVYFLIVNNLTFLQQTLLKLMANFLSLWSLQTEATFLII